MKEVTVSNLLEKKRRHEKITALTAYDTPMAEMLDRLGIDLILVGDSVGMVLLGYSSTRFVTMDEMIHHTKAVRRGVKRAYLVGDMPYRSYQTPAAAYKNACRFIDEAGCDAVKLEGGEAVLPVLRFLRKKKIQVQGHLGLLPQSVKPGTPFHLKAKDPLSAKQLMEEASLLEKEGAFSIILECIPYEVGRMVTALVKIPTIGIGAGPFCDGQILVTHDLLGLFQTFKPRFVKPYADLAQRVGRAVATYRREVSNRSFPTLHHSFSMAPEALRQLKRITQSLRHD
ncbi:MAG: 3-methyl-2-oxobutanoate hydroxymethyltransferase [Candidatus Omnitrophica bacterium]|nr:3-methyl-2-oxobutanoate hydroxymethyltransferase [Candidatus Omnitrophota bacterium]